MSGGAPGGPLRQSWAVEASRYPTSSIYNQSRPVSLNTHQNANKCESERDGQRGPEKASKRHGSEDKEKEASRYTIMRFLRGAAPTQAWLQAEPVLAGSRFSWAWGLPAEDHTQPTHIPSLFLYYGSYCLQDPLVLLLYLLMSTELTTFHLLESTTPVVSTVFSSTTVSILSPGGYTLQPRVGDQGHMPRTLHAIHYIASESCFCVSF